MSTLIWLYLLWLHYYGHTYCGYTYYGYTYYGYTHYGHTFMAEFTMIYAARLLGVAVPLARLYHTLHPERARVVGATG